MFPDDPIWTEPARGSYPGVELMGLAGRERMGSRESPTVPPPPIHHLFGLTPEAAFDEGSLFSMPASPWLNSGPGVYLAGVSALVNDAPLGSAVLSQVPAGVYGVTSDLSMSFLRPASVDSGTLMGRSRVIAVGRSLGLSEATVTDAAGNVLSHTTSRYFLNRLPETPPRPEKLEVVIPSFDTPDPYQRPLSPHLTKPPEDLLSMSGLEIFRAVIAGDVPHPPFAELFGMRVTEVSDGRITWIARASKWLTSPAQTIYGGVIAFFADAATMGAVSTTLPAGHSAATLDLKVQYLRPGFADDRDIVIRGEVVHRGRSLAISRGELLNADGKQLALATSSTMVIERPWQSVAVADEPSTSED